jgi:Terminase small subunit
MTAEPVEAQLWGELGPAMRDLNPRQREFVRSYLTISKRRHGRATAAARAAGYTGNHMRNHAHDLMRNPKIIAALDEELKKFTRGRGYADAVLAAYEGILNPEHRDHARFVDMFFSRGDPAVSKHAVDVTHRTIDPDREALEELRALRRLGTTREKLLELYGGNGLDRLEALEAVENAQRAAAAKIIDGNAIEHSEANHG